PAVARSVLGDQSDLIRNQAPTSPLVDPHADRTVQATGFLPAVFPLQCDTASDDCRVSINAHVLILAPDRLDLSVSRPDVLESLAVAPLIRRGQGLGQAHVASVDTQNRPVIDS